MSAHAVRVEYADDSDQDSMGDESAWRAAAVNRDDVEIAEAWGRTPLAAVCRLAGILADENEARAGYLPDDYVDLACRDDPGDAPGAAARGRLTGEGGRQSTDSLHLQP